MKKKIKLTKETTKSMKPIDFLSPLCEICSLRPQEQLHHTVWDRETGKSNKDGPTQKICTLCHAKIHGIEPRKSELKRLVLLHNRTQKARCVIDNQIRGFSRIELLVPEFMNELSEDLEEKEKAYAKDIKIILEGESHLDNAKTQKEVAYPSYKWLRSIKGISHLLAGKLIAYVDISKSPTVSSLWAYAGQTPDSKKTKGKKANWNQELKMICYQIGDSFIKQRTPKYREIYDIEKAKQMKLAVKEGSQIRSLKRSQIRSLKIKGIMSPLDSKSEFNQRKRENHKPLVDSVPKSKMHAHLRAMRKMIKAFLKDYWLQSQKTIIKLKPITSMSSDKIITEFEIPSYMKERYIKEIMPRVKK